MKNIHIAYWAVLIIVALILGGLGGWYYFLRTSTQSTVALDAARGLQSSVPAFSGSTGSTNQNITLALQAEQESSGVSASSTGALWEVSSEPVAGADFAGSTTLTYVTRSTGYVFQADPKARTTLRITNTLRPKIYDALFAPGFVLERSLSSSGSTENFLGYIATTSESSSSTIGTLLGSDLDGPAAALAVNVSTKMLLYTALQPDGSVLGIQSDLLGLDQKKIFWSPLSNWRLWWLSDGKIVLTQKAADTTPGYAYSISKDGSFVPLASGPGLTILPRASSTALLIGNSSGGALTLSVQASNKTAPVALSVATLADKCAWAPGTTLAAYCAVPKQLPSSDFLDDWYRGVVHSDDSIWKIDVLNATSTDIFDGAGQGPFDVTSPSIDSTGMYLSFINGNDGSLWVLRLTQ